MSSAHPHREAQQRTKSPLNHCSTIGTTSSATDPSPTPSGALKDRLPDSGPRLQQALVTYPTGWLAFHWYTPPAILSTQVRVQIGPIGRRSSIKYEGHYENAQIYKLDYVHGTFICSLQRSSLFTSFTHCDVTRMPKHLQLCQGAIIFHVQYCYDSVLAIEISLISWVPTDRKAPCPMDRSMLGS